MTTDFRAICAELDALLNDIASTHPNLSENGVRVVNDLSDRARTLLAQPVTEEPTDETPWEINDDDFLLFSPANAMAFQAQKRSRRGRPTPQPVVPTDDDLEDLAEVMNVSGNPVPAMRRALELWGTNAQ